MVDKLSDTAEESATLVEATDDELESLKVLADTTEESVTLVDTTKEELDWVEELEDSHSGQ